MTYELLRQYAIVLKNSLRNEFFKAFSLWKFICNHACHSLFYRSQKVISLLNLEGQPVFFRTHTSDLSVFLQHFVYQELNQPTIRNLAPPALILDAGANIGLASLVLARFFPECLIIAIEMEESNYHLLEKNCRNLIATKRLLPLKGAFLSVSDGFFH